jgi:hypothetical protein
MQHCFTKRGVQMNDGWVVPYNPASSAKYNCHINVEICCGIQHYVKYCYKYMTKGIDKASVTLHRIDDEIDDGAMNTCSPVLIDEVQKYIDSRYVGSSEAFWRILGNEMHSHYPHVVRLQIHEEHQQSVVYRPGTEMDAITDEPSTMLTDYFATVLRERINPLHVNELGFDSFGKHYPAAHSLTYGDFPKYYSWLSDKKHWRRRSRNKKADTIGRIYTVHPRSGDRYYLRILLSKRPGLGSFTEARTVNGIEYVTYKGACEALGYLANDDEWKDCLMIAADDILPKALRDLFVSILIFNEPADALALWELEWTEPDNGRTVYLKNALSADYRYKRNQLRRDKSCTFEQSDYDNALCYMNKSIQQFSCKYNALLKLNFVLK